MSVLATALGSVGRAAAIAPPAALGPYYLFGHTVGIQRELALLAAPVLAVLVALVMLRRGRGAPTDRERAGLLASRLLVVSLLVLAAAGPYTVAIQEGAADPSVTLLEDRSASTEITPAIADKLERQIEDHGVRVDRSVIASGNESRIGDGILANVRANGSVLVLSDGQVTAGRSLQDLDTVLDELNATVNSVIVDPETPELAVELTGTETTSVDVPNYYEVTVEGVVPPNTTVDGEVAVAVDGTTVETVPVESARTNATVVYNFSERGTHTVTAQLRLDDRFEVNDVYRKTVTVVPKPSVLYVSGGDHRLADYLERLYDVTRADRVPDDLSEYEAVVAQDLPAAEAGNVSALQRHVLEGKGLLLVGGNNSFEHGDYAGTPLERMAPVTIERGSDVRSRFVILMDISASGRHTHAYKKAVAANVIDQIGDDNAVGVIAFDDDVYRISRLGPLGQKRQELRETVLAIENGYATDLPAGLRAARNMLNGAPGTVLFLSDGADTNAMEEITRVSRSLGDRNAGVISIPVGNDTDEEAMKRIAALSGGQYLVPNESGQISLTFDDSDGTLQPSTLTILDEQHFITTGLRTDALLERANAVAVKRGADYLISTSSGSPSLTAWRYGVGRVAAITTYASDGGLGDLLSRPDSKAISRSVNWVVADPQRTADRLARIPDTRVGAATTVTYNGESRPTEADVSFVRTAEDRYEATIRPQASGFAELLGSAYAVNYPAEYASMGPSGELRELVVQSGGQRFQPGETAQIASAVVEQTSRRRSVRTDWTWIVGLAGLGLLALEITIRRLRRFRGRGVIP